MFATFASVPASTPTEVLDALEQFIGQIHCGAQNAGLETLIDVDLSFSQAKSLFVLSQSPTSIPIHELAESLRLSVGATGRNVEQLVKHGFVDRQEDDSDRRIKRISLTAAGHDLIAGFRAQQRQSALEFVQSLPQEDRDRLLGALVPIIDRFAAPSQSDLPDHPGRRPSVAVPPSTRAQEQLV
jgi:DNA-binding MarR family transcriptional regulator